jgi:rhodanese-related sulfurtransferase
MANILKTLFRKQDDLKTIHANGAIVVDVRTPEEFKAGHIAGALNIPLHSLKASVGDLKKQGKPIITCCLSGARSAMALSLLSQAGLEA